MLLICNSVCKAIFLAASRGKGDTGTAAETWAQVAPATRATTSTRRRKTWKEENIEENVLTGKHFFMSSRWRSTGLGEETQGKVVGNVAPQAQPSISLSVMQR